MIWTLSPLFYQLDSKPIAHTFDELFKFQHLHFVFDDVISFCELSDVIVSSLPAAAADKSSLGWPWCQLDKTLEKKNSVRKSLGAPRLVGWLGDSGQKMQIAASCEGEFELHNFSFWLLCQKKPSIRKFCETEAPFRSELLIMAPLFNYQLLLLWNSGRKKLFNTSSIWDSVL